MQDKGDFKDFFFNHKNLEDVFLALTSAEMNRADLTQFEGGLEL
jgi:hypothetical protein